MEKLRHAEAQVGHALTVQYPPQPRSYHYSQKNKPARVARNINGISDASPAASPMLWTHDPVADGASVREGTRSIGTAIMAPGCGSERLLGSLSRVVY